jgi:nicotinamide-nucleotide amidase
MKAIILSVGDELVLGQTVDTNSAYLSAQLSAVGCDTVMHRTVGDDQAMIAAAIRESTPLCDLLIISGGIGPTEDDLTRQAIAEVMNVPLEQNDAWMEKLEAFFKARGRAMPQTNRIQAMIPRGATMLDNPAGTAAGIRVRLGALVKSDMPLSELKGRQIGRILSKMGRLTKEQLVDALERQKREGGKLGGILIAMNTCSREEIEYALAAQEGRVVRGCEVFSVPGVPKEMKAMFVQHVLPYVKQHTGTAVIFQRKLNTFGLGESWVAERLGNLMMRQRNPSVGTTVSDGYVSLRINARYETLERAEHEAEQTVEQCRTALGDIIFGEGDETLAQAVAKLLKAKDVEVTTAESCTGGLLAKMLTDIPGSSAYFRTGFITYHNKSKYDRLGVSENILNCYGAVSEPVVEAMARNALRLSKADIALSISGIAGPDGGSPTKPVGMVCIGMAVQVDRHKVDVTTRTFNFPGDREMIRDRSAKMALSMLRYHLLESKMPF